ncbi:MAG: hypothetical protein ACWGOV_01685 [Acidiferrobacterales bacterium]
MCARWPLSVPVRPGISQRNKASQEIRRALLYQVRLIHNPISMG